jgi:2-polyprenyl-6-methoxyphenol hydroxylase-like FAD-dependent oxidoreductase
LHIASSCKGVSLALAGTTSDGAWLSSGPLRTGIRTFGRNGIFTVGNAAAETHPIVAEGISIAIQSAALLCEQLIARPQLIRDGASAVTAYKAARAHYAAAWRANFSPRLFVAAVFASVFTRPIATRIATTLLERFPQLLAEGARWSGKVQPLHGMSTSGEVSS